jgi:hypothetical protein
MIFVKQSHFADPDAAARKLLEIAHTEAVQDGRIYIELVNAAFSRLEARRPNTAPVSSEP